MHEIHDNFGTAHLAVFLPHYDFDERHEIKISAQPPIVFDKVMKLDLRRSLLIRTLFALRSLPGVFQRGGGRQPSLGLTMDTLLKSGFVLLAKNPDKEIVLGLVGRFWSACGDLQKINAEAFQQFNQPGFAKAVWNFSLHATSSGTILRTETRVKCLDDQSRKQFARYWRIVKPFSGWVRKEALRIIKSEAEKMKETA